MSKKRPDTGSITNELEGASLFFHPAQTETPPAPIRPLPAEERTIERSSVRSENRTEKRTEIRTVELPIRRPARRYSFEFYDDQIVEMKRLKHEAEMRGEKVSLSDIARQAIDVYLERIIERHSERKSERSEEA
jgi:hypothetical protein